MLRRKLRQPLTMMACEERTSIVLLILSLRTNWMWVMNCRHRLRYARERGWVGNKPVLHFSEQRRTFCHCRNSNPSQSGPWPKHCTNCDIIYNVYFLWIWREQVVFRLDSTWLEYWTVMIFEHGKKYSGPTKRENIYWLNKEFWFLKNNYAAWIWVVLYVTHGSIRPESCALHIKFVLMKWRSVHLPYLI
jgi:hypothetical protein